MREIAARSQHVFWTNDEYLYAFADRAAAGARPITALQALEKYGLDHLWDASEYAMSNLKKPVDP